MKTEENKIDFAPFLEKTFTFHYMWNKHNYDTQTSDCSINLNHGKDIYVTRRKVDIDAWNDFNEHCRNQMYDFWNVEYLEAEVEENV